METLQPTKQNDMVANNNNCKVPMNKQTTDEVKTNKYTGRLRYLTSTWRAFIKLNNTKSRTEHEEIQNRHEHY